jgi:hypothetical protein
MAVKANDSAAYDDEDGCQSIHRNGESIAWGLLGSMSTKWD